MTDNFPMSYVQIRNALFKLIDALNYMDQICNLHDCNDCGIKNECQYLPKLGDAVRINCPLWKPKQKENK